MMILTQDNFFNFWPSNSQSESERIYATARFIIYGTLVAFALKRNTKILILGTVLLVGLYLYSRSVQPLVQMKKSFEDPFSNFGNQEYQEATAKRWARETFKDPKNAERNFYTVPSNDMGTFLEFVHGGKNKPFCRQNQSACTAEHNPMFMEEPQRRVLRDVF